MHECGSAQDGAKETEQLVLYPGRAGRLHPGAWSDGLCDCFSDCSICLLACSFPWWRWSLTVARARYLGLKQAVALFIGLSLLSYACTVLSGALDEHDVARTVLPIAVLVIDLVLVLVVTAYRTKLRRQYGIPGSVCEDCCCSCCCFSLTIAQQARHVDRDYGFLV